MFLIQCTVTKSSCPVLNYGDVVYQFCSFLSSSLDVVYHGALRLIPDCISSAHHCVLYNRIAIAFIDNSKSNALVLQELEDK